jgi:hypothetical protein
MKIHLEVLELLHASRQTDKAKIIGAFLQLFIANIPKTKVPSLYRNLYLTRTLSKPHFPFLF